MAGRFPLYTDADVNGPLVLALRLRGWDIVRAIEAFPERTRDPIHFDAAVSLGRVLVSNDRDQIVLALSWLGAGKPFPGLVSWPNAYHRHSNTGAFVRAFEALAAREDNPFAYPIFYLKPHD